MFDFFIVNNLNPTNQFNQFTNQLLLITHGIYTSFDEGYEVRGVFLNILKAFDEVWNEGLIFKLKQNGISGKLLRDKKLPK